MERFDITKFNLVKYDELLSYGLSYSLGICLPGQMCIEAVICNVLGLDHNDDPGCVAESVRIFKIGLNDSNWSTNLARSSGLRDFGLAQLGSKDNINDANFLEVLTFKIITRLIPQLFYEIYPNDKTLLVLADKCKDSGDMDAAITNIKKAAADAAADAYTAARNADAYAAVRTARAADAAGDKYLILAAQLAVETLRELGSPGCMLLLSGRL